LNAVDAATIDSWIIAGAPRGDLACTPPAATPPTTTPLTCTPDVHMKPASAWKMPAGTDDV